METPKKFVKLNVVNKIRIQRPHDDSLKETENNCKLFIFKRDYFQSGSSLIEN